jgi:hypothetical protein
MIMSDRQAPISPNIPPEAPTVMYSGRKIALRSVPPIADIIKMIAVARVPVIKCEAGCTSKKLASEECWRTYHVQFQ